MAFRENHRVSRHNGRVQRIEITDFFCFRQVKDGFFDVIHDILIDKRIRMGPRASFRQKTLLQRSGIRHTLNVDQCKPDIRKRGQPGFSYNKIVHVLKTLADAVHSIGDIAS